MDLPVTFDDVVDYSLIDGGVLNQTIVIYPTLAQTKLPKL
jgi:hypothetical protein